ncbi:MAG: pyridoxal phosphate-dependent aminotransferase [bacterium]|nr:pyridoxal phosphate-dependent aminotransferase [bacterium]
MKKFKQKRNNISDRVENINYSAVRKAFSAGRNRDVINLTIGQPDFETPKSLRDAAKRSIDRGFNRYTETKGVLKLRKAISQKLARGGVMRNKDEIIVTAGTTSAIFMTLFSLVNEGDEVIVFSPYFVAYTEIIKYVGGKVIIVKTDDNFQPNDLELLEKSITTKTKAIIINSPNNPTGAVYSASIIAQIVKIARKYGIYIISDEIYRSFVYDKAKFFSPAEIYSDTLVIDGLSKSKAVTGWRIGFIAGPQKIINAVEKLQQFTTVCAPSVFQYASIEAINKKLEKNILTEYQNRRDFVYMSLKNVLPTIKPKGAFYFFIKTPVSGAVFAKRLLKKGLAVVPGSAFGDKFENYIRISYAASKEKLSAAVSIIKKEVALLTK